MGPGSLSGPTLCLSRRRVNPGWCLERVFLLLLTLTLSRHAASEVSVCGLNWSAGVLFPAEGLGVHERVFFSGVKMYFIHDYFAPIIRSFYRADPFHPKRRTVKGF